jgi:hypothetical protein
MAKKSNMDMNMFISDIFPASEPRIFCASSMRPFGLPDGDSRREARDQNRDFREDNQ